MTSDYEDLSRLLDGELAPVEAEALRARIAGEPRLAAAWERMRALPRDLGALPDELPPPGLDDRVLGRTRPPSRRGRWIALTATLAAALVLWVGTRPGAGRVLVISGEQWVDGQMDVLAGEIPVRVDGLARIAVEPALDVVRERAGEEATMNAVLAGAGGVLAGAAVTVAVMRGAATLAPPDEDPIVVRAGERRTVAPDERVAETSATLPPRPRLPDGATAAQRIASLEAEVVDLRAKLAEVEFTHAVARGQLLAEQGEPLPWPEDLAEYLRPDAFETMIRENVATIPGLTVHSIDCSEFPCIAALRASDPAEGWEDRLRTLPPAISPGEELGVWMAITGGDVKGTTVGMALMPGEGGEELSRRIEWRSRALLEDAATAEP